MRAGGRRTGTSGGSGTGGLRDRDAVVLLRASLDPEALLDAGRLAEFYDTLLVSSAQRGEGLGVCCWHPHPLGGRCLFFLGSASMSMSWSTAGC